MLPLERQNQILELLMRRKAATVEELCAALYSSGATIRRDLALLEESGQIRRTHGGAVYLDNAGRDFPLMLRESENMEAKEVIASKALSLIQDGQTLFLDSSSTVCRFAQRLTGFSNLRVVTNGMKTANLLADVEGVELYLTGGRLREHALSFIGHSAVNFVGQFSADWAFISCRGVDETVGVTEASEEEAEVKLAFLRAARRTALLADASKLGQRFFRRVAALEELDALLCDRELPPAYGERLAADNRHSRGK